MAAAAQRGAGGAGDLGRALLFFVVIAYYWVSLQPFADLGLASNSDPWAGNSNAFNQAVAIALFGVLLLFAWRHPLARQIAQPRLLLGLLLGWFTLTALLADDPGTALRRVVMAAMVVISGSILLLLPRDERHFVRLLGTVFALLLGLAYYGVLVMPGLSIHQSTDVVEPLLAGNWRGFFSHKNVAAPAMAFIIFAGMFVWSRWSKLLGVLLIGLALLFLFNTGGKTSLAMVPLALVLAFLFERWRGLRLPLVVGGLGLFNLVTVGSAVWPPLRGFVTSLGIDASFTDRIEIWQLAVSAIQQRPLTGYGFSSFWQTEALVYGGGSVETWAVTAANAHNAYLDAAMAAGIPGLVLVVLWLVVGPVRDMGRAEIAGNDPLLTRLFLRIWLYGLFASCLESFFFASSGPVWITILIAVFGLRFQRQSQLMTAAVPARRAVHA